MSNTPPICPECEGDEIHAVPADRHVAASLIVTSVADWGEGKGDFEVRLDDYSPQLWRFVCQDEECRHSGPLAEFVPG